MPLCPQQSAPVHGWIGSSNLYRKIVQFRFPEEFISTGIKLYVNIQVLDKIIGIPVKKMKIFN